MHIISDVKIFDIQMDSTVNNKILDNINGTINIGDFLSVIEKGDSYYVYSTK